jgi:hypothetical protein
MTNAETTFNSGDLPQPMKLPTAAPWLAASNTQLLDQQTPQFLTQDFRLDGFGEAIVHSGTSIFPGLPQRRWPSQ